MRTQHELNKGVICEKCLYIANKGEYKRINVLESITNDTTGRYKTINRINLCNQCYKDMEELMHNFIKEK